MLPLQDDLEICLVRFPDGSTGSSDGRQEKPPRGCHSLPVQRQQQQPLGAEAAAEQGGVGLQPGGPRGHREEVPQERLVQDAAAAADCQRGGLHQPHHHQPLLLRAVQLLLHPTARQKGGGVLPVLCFLQATQGHLFDRAAGVPRAGPTVPTQEDSEGQAVPVHVCESKQLRQTVRTGM